MGETVSRLSQRSCPSGAFWAETRNHEGYSGEWHYNYSSVIGFFRQDTARTDRSAGAFEAMEKNFGLIKKEYSTDRFLPDNGRGFTQWQRFANKLNDMNQRAPNEVTYRLLYLGRHGQGYHNIGQMFYGDAAWDCYYCTFNQDPHVPTVTFLDAHLTRLGRHQAQTASTFWQNLISTQKIPLPQSYYSSPHSRAIQTAQLTFSALPRSPSQHFGPLVKELLREGYGIQTCDLRPTKSYIQTNFPNFRLENSFTETDELYSPTRREPPQHRIRRLRTLLDDIFAHDQSTFISMTSHGGTIEAILLAIGHERIFVPTGGIIPVLVKVKKASGKRNDDDNDEEWETKPDCKSSPLEAGKQGYKDIAEFLEEIDRGVPEQRGSMEDPSLARS